MLRDPQRFNLYAYVRNSPLWLIDPTGKTIELTGNTDSERKKQLAAIQKAVGDKATVGIKQDDKGHYNVTISGDTTKGAAKDFASIIGNSEVAKFALVGKYDSLGILGGKSLSEYNAVGATGRTSDGQLWVNVQSGADGCCSSISASQFDFSHSSLATKIWDTLAGVPADVATETGHEFGHAKYFMTVGKSGQYNLGQSNKAALDLENKVRQAHDPSAPIRTTHP